jgi:hypothetical protein
MHKVLRKVSGFTLLLGGLLVSGCVAPQVTDLENQLAQKNQELSSLKSSVAAKEGQVGQLEGALKQRDAELERRSMAARDAQMAAERAEARAKAGEGRPVTVSGDTELFPPNAKPGECYARVFVPPTYKTTSSRVLVHEASEHLRIVPAKYRWVDKTVLVRASPQRSKSFPLPISGKRRGYW